MWLRLSIVLNILFLFLTGAAVHNLLRLQHDEHLMRLEFAKAKVLITMQREALVECDR